MEGQKKNLKKKSKEAISPILFVCMSKIVTEIVVMLKNERHFHKKIEGNFQESMKGLFGAFYFSQENNNVFIDSAKLQLLVCLDNPW